MTDIEKKFAIRSLPINASHIPAELYNKILTDNKFCEKLENHKIYIVRKDEMGILLTFDIKQTVFTKDLPAELAGCMLVAYHENCNAVELICLDSKELPPRTELKIYK